MAAWGKRWSRLLTMSWGEFHTRTRQELSKRYEVAAHRVGLAGKRHQLCDRGPEPGKFFFSKKEIPQIVALLRQNLGSEVAGVVREAEEVCEHRFRLLGYENVDYGRDIDWHLDAVHGKRAPLKPWFKIRFLDFEEVGDHKVTWELNRHQHLVTLAKAWHFAADLQGQKYVQEIVAEWNSWQRANPYPMGINWGSSLEVAFRSLSWIWVDHLLADCPYLTADFRARLINGLALNGGYIERYLSTYFSPNTHLLGEAVALFFIGTLYPQIRGAERWQRKGWQIAIEEAGRQVRPDGVYFEQALYYHVYALDFFLHLRRLASLNAFEIPASFDRTVEKMSEVVKALSQAGPPIGFGDDDGGRLFNPRRNRAEHLADPLAVSALTFARKDFAQSAYLTEEAAWLFGDQAATLHLGADRFEADLKTKAFRDGGIYIMAEAETRSQLVVDAGPQGTGHAGHGHADALSITLSVHGRPSLVDSGSYGYISDDNHRNAFRGTAAHNTLLVDGQDQAIADGPFAWKALPSVRVERWFEGGSFSLLVGSHDGYERLAAPVIHRRFVFHLRGAFWLIRDLAMGRGLHQLQTSWHFAPQLAVAKVEGGFVSEPLSPADGNGAAPRTRVALLMADDPEWTAELCTGEISYAYGSKQAAEIVRMSASAQLPCESAVLAIPLQSGETPGRFFRIPGEQHSGVHGYGYDHGEELRHLFLASEGATWRVGPWSSDARFFFCRIRNRRLEKLVICEGRFVEADGQSILEYPSAVDWLEWTDRDGKIQVCSSDEDAVQAFSRHGAELCEVRF